MHMLRPKLCVLWGRTAYFNSWAHLLVEEYADYTGKHAEHQRLLLRGTLDLEDMLIMVVAQPGSLSSRIVSLSRDIPVQYRSAGIKGQ